MPNVSPCGFLRDFPRDFQVSDEAARRNVRHKRPICDSRSCKAAAVSFEVEHQRTCLPGPASLAGRERLLTLTKRRSLQLPKNWGAIAIMISVDLSAWEGHLVAHPPLNAVLIAPGKQSRWRLDRQQAQLLSFSIWIIKSSSNTGKHMYTHLLTPFGIGLASQALT